MTRTDQSMLDEVNRSGFPLQIGVERLVRKHDGSNLNWKVRYVEHEYDHPRESDPGFIDLVLWNDGEVIQLVIECKRVQDTAWLFLQPYSAQDVTRVKSFVAHSTSQRTLYGWEDLHAKLASPESSY